MTWSSLGTWRVDTCGTTRQTARLTERAAAVGTEIALKPANLTSRWQHLDAGIAKTWKELMLTRCGLGHWLDRSGRNRLLFVSRYDGRQHLGANCTPSGTVRFTNTLCDALVLCWTPQVLATGSSLRSASGLSSCQVGGQQS